MNFDLLTGVLIKYHVLFYYLALGLNLFFIRGGAFVAFAAIIGLFWVFCTEVVLMSILNKLPWFFFWEGLIYCLGFFPVS